MANKFHACLQGTDESLYFIKDASFHETEEGVFNLSVTEDREKAVVMDSENEIIEWIIDQFGGAIKAFVAEFEDDGTFVGVRPPIRTNA
mgnify:FL=1